MKLEKLNNKYFWRATTIVLMALTFLVADPFYLELSQIGLTISTVALLMRVFNIQPWSGGSCTKNTPFKS